MPPLDPPAHHSDPTPQDASDIARVHLGWSRPRATRFTTGQDYFVYDLTEGDRNMVIRIGRPDKAAALAQSIDLWQRLSPLGVPLPRLLGHGIHETLPFVIMTRLPGTDLGNVISGLSRDALISIAEHVADAQLVVAGLGQATGKGTGFGYAARPEAAPHRSWSQVIEAHVERSIRRIRAKGCFPPSVSDIVVQQLARYRPALDAVPPTPFLHDTTTKNVIVTAAGQFSGIVDVDDLCFGDPRYAPALTQAALLAFYDSQPDYVRRWMARMGLRHDSIFAFYTAVFILDFMSEQGMTFNGNQRPVDPVLIIRLPRLLEQILAASA